MNKPSVTIRLVSNIQSQIVRNGICAPNFKREYTIVELNSIVHYSIYRLPMHYMLTLYNYEDYLYYLRREGLCCRFAWEHENGGENVRIMPEAWQLRGMRHFIPTQGRCLFHCRVLMWFVKNWKPLWLKNLDQLKFLLPVSIL